MNVFDLQAKIGLNISGYVKGIKNAVESSKQIVNELSSVVNQGNKVQDSVDKASKSIENVEDASKAAQYSLDMVSDATDEVEKNAKKASDAVDDLNESLNEEEDASKKTEKQTDGLNDKVKEEGEESKKTGKENEKLGEKTKKIGDEAEKAGNKFEKFAEGLKNVSEKVGSVVSTFAKIGAVSFGAAASGLAALTKQSLDAYANYEQLKGGVETLFGAGGMSVQEYADNVGKSVDDVQGHYSKLISAQNKVLDNSYKAYQTAGMSANQYMETVTSFSASLLQSVGNDTNIAADIADMAIRDMSDNANKMGTSMESIQNAYQGFAKQNYTINLMSAA